MNAINYDKKLTEITDNLGGERKKLLLHACCAPCSSACLERLKEHFEITVFYYNPNIEEDEYALRKAEQIRFLKETGWADILDCDHEGEKFYEACRGTEHLPEGGARCLKCFELRLARTAAEARAGGYEYFATTLTVSPLKPAAAINAIGERLAESCGVKWLPSDFKKRGGYQRSCALAREYSLYRQNYCGCEFSRKERERADAQRKGGSQK